MSALRSVAKASMLVLLLLAARLNAQGVERAARVGVLAGLSAPIGEFSDNFDPGRHLGITLGFRPRTWPLGLRLDGVYHRNGVKNVDFHQRVYLLTANIEYRFNTAGATTPYLIAGAGRGWGRLIDDLGDADDEGSSAPAWNAGGGMVFLLAGFELFVEARYHSVDLDERTIMLVPLSVGLVF